MAQQVNRNPYSHGHSDAVLRSHRWRNVENSGGYLRDRLTPGVRVLDVGCGPGTLTASIASLVAPGEVLGIDVSTSVIDEAASIGAEEQLENLSFSVLDLHSTALSPSSFDVVHAHQVLQHLDDPVAAIRRMAELTRPGGTVAFRDSDYSAMTWSPGSAMLDAWLALYLEITKRNRAEANAGRWLLHWARQANLDDVVYSTSTWTYSTPQETKWWSELWAERALHSNYGEQALAYGLATQSDLDAISEGWRAWGASVDPVFIIPHGEVVATPR